MKPKTYLITGCSKGIGFEFVKIALEKGHKVIGISRNITPLNNLNHQNLSSLSIDISNYESINSLRKWIDEHNIYLDALINNAGYLINKPFEEISIQEINQVLNTNFTGPTLLIQSLINRLNDGAHILNIGSMGGFQGSVKFPGLSIYSSSKGALSILTECLAEEFKEKNLIFNCLCLGSVQTEMLQKAFPGYQAPISSKEMAKYFYNFISLKPSLYKGKVLPVSLSTP